MKPWPFAYHRPTTLEGALRVLSDVGEDAKVLAGGQSLVPLMNLRLARPSALIDINAVRELELMTSSGVTWTIGSTVRHHALEHSDRTDAIGSFVRKVAGHIGHLPIRVRGTIGGSLAHADPASEWCVLSRLLDASFVARSAPGGAPARFRRLLRITVRYRALARRDPVPRRVPGARR